MAEIPADSNLPGPAAPTVERINLPGADFIRGAAGMPMVRQLVLLVAIAASVAVGVVAVLWMQSPDYRPLTGVTSPSQANEVAKLLDAAAIAHKIDTRTGMIMVPQESFHRAQMTLAGSGQIRFDESQPGYEQLDKDQGFGVSQFMELARYRQSIEGELARSIASLDAVRHARVLLATPKSTTFLRDQRRPSASVTVRLAPGNTLTDQQIRGITNLVAKAVPEMQPEDVAVVDQTGKLLSRKMEDPGLDQSERQLAYVARIEDQLVSKVGGLLRPIVGPDRFGVQVTADVDFTRSEQAEELYNPAQSSIRSEQRLEEQNMGEGGAAGVPGALTNQPPETQAGADVELTEEGAVAAPQRSRSELTRNYEIDRTVAYTQRAVGAVTRLTVSVIVDDLPGVDAESGEASSTPWTDEELAQLEQSIRSAVGYSAERGDVITVTNRTFFQPELAPLTPAPFWTEGWFLDLAKQGLLALVLLVLAIGLLRPLFKNLSQAGAAVQEHNAALLQQVRELPAGMPVDPSRPEAGMLLPASAGGYAAKVDAVRGLVQEDPGRVAQVVKHWVATDE